MHSAPAPPTTSSYVPSPDRLGAPEPLPVHLTGFVGRARELDDIVRLLGATRLLTLTGAGGSGKTRLAREAAGRALCPETPVTALGGAAVAWVDLTACTDPDQLPGRVAGALRLPGRADAAPLEAVRAAVGDAPLLLVLDNCEHLLDAAAETADALLRTCPALRVLATSREALGVAGETAWLVPALVAPEARQLFVERAQAALATFSLDADNAAAVDEICRRLDGIPLAIELAAARVRALTPEQIATRLDDAFRLLSSGHRTALPRHRTLRATMEWSHTLLAEREQVLLRRLAVFAGGFTLDAAERVCAGDRLAPDDILDGVAALVDKSLVVMEAEQQRTVYATGTGDTVTDDVEPRYRLLETVRQYARERLVEAAELDDAEAAHARYFLAFVEALVPHVELGQPDPTGMARLGVERDNLRAAGAWALAAAARDPAAHGTLVMRLAESLFWYWYGAGHWLHRNQFSEARRFTTDATRLAPHVADPLLRARALMAAGLSAHPQGDYDEARDHFAGALAIAREHDHVPLVVFAACKLGAAYLMLGDLDRAWALNEEAHALAATQPPSMLHSFVQVWRCVTATERGDLAEARRVGEANVRAGEALGQPVTVAHASALLARAALRAGDLDEAQERLGRALRLHLEIADAWGLALDLEWLSELAARRGRHADAVRLMGAVDAVRSRVAIVILGIDRAGRAAREAAARARLGEAGFAACYAEGATLGPDALLRLAADDSSVHTAEHRVVAPAGRDAAPTAPVPAIAPPPAPPQRAPASRDVVAPLRVRALGALEVSVGERAIEAAAWGSARTRELLVFLLAHPEGVTKEQVGVALWPDASTSQLRNNFHVTLHRLRKALGSAEWVALDGERYRVDAAPGVEFDAAIFEEEATAACRALARGGAQAPAAADALARALATYRGDFLAGEPAGDWHQAWRERLQRVCVDGWLALGAHRAATGDAAAAAEAYRQALGRDALCEEAVRGLMRAHAALGERPQALRVYQRFATLLAAELEVEPDDETVELFAQVQAS